MKKKHHPYSSALICVHPWTKHPYLSADEKAPVKKNAKKLETKPEI